MLDLDTLPLSRKQIVSIVEAQSTPQLALWSGAVAAGKTIASLLAFLIAITVAPESGLIVMIGRTLQTIERNLLDPLQDERLFGPLSRHVHHTAGSSTAVILGRVVHLIGAADSRAEGRIRGATIALAYVDEATLLPEGFWVMLLSRLRVPGAKMFATTNPASPAHFLRRDYILRAAEVGMRWWHFTLEDNPGLEPEFVERLKRQYVGLYYRRFILGEWIAAEGSIYDMFDPDVHVVDVIPPIVNWLCAGIDYGTSNPTHAVLLGLGADSCLYVVSEWRHDSRQAHRQLTDSEYSTAIRGWLEQVKVPASRSADGTWMLGVRPHYIVVDPSAASFRTQLHRDGMSPVLANNAVLDGIRLVASLLAMGKLKIHRSCEALTAELPGYAWDDRAAALGEDKPIKADDHGCLIAGTPVVTDAGERPIESIRPGDRVLTRGGWKPVIAAGMTDPAAATVRVHLSSGNVLEGTGNHPVFVRGHGWKSMDSLRYGDIMESWQTSTSSVIRESNSGATRTRRTGPNVRTTRRGLPTGSAASSGFTKKSGWTRTGRSQMAATSITKTMTRSTTTCQTSPASPATSTRPNMVPAGLSAPARPSNSLTLRRSARSPWHGIAAKKAGNGIASTESRRGRTVRRLTRLASSAATASSRSRAARTTASAPTPASRRGDGTQGWTTRIAPATGAAAHSGSTSTAGPRTAPVRVVAVAASPGSPVPVFNLQMPPDCPEYFAAGVLVHNCDALRYGIYSTRALWRNAIPLGAQAA